MSETEELSIVFNVEDGTCVFQANSYVSIEEANQYNTNKNRTAWLSLSDTEKKVSLIKATQYVNELYNWKGVRQYEEQELAFPRVKKHTPAGDVYMLDRDGFAIRGIPLKLRQAVCEAAFYAYQANAELFSVYQSETGGVKRERKAVSGAVEKDIEYFSNSEVTTDYISKYVALDKLLKGLYWDKNHHDICHKVDWGV